MNAVTYARQSVSGRDESPDDTLSTAFQTRAAADAAQRAGYVVVDHYRDVDVSGARRDRAGLDALLARVARGDIAAVYIYSVSRLSRDTRIFLNLIDQLQRHRVELKSATETLEDRTLAIVLSALAERERVDTSNRNAAVVRERAHAGRFTRKPPYGYRRGEGGTLAVEEPEAEVVRRVFAWRLAGVRPVAIAARLAADPLVPPRRGNGRWTATAVRRLLACRTYAGDVVIEESRDPWGRVRPAVAAPGLHPAIVDREAFDRAQVLGRHGTPYTRRKPAAPWLDGRLVCAACGHRLYLATATARIDPETDAPYRSWRCGLRQRHRNGNHPDDCPGPVWSRKATWVDRACRTALMRDVGRLVPVATAVRALAARGDDAATAHRRELARRKAALESRAAHLLEALETGNLPASVYGPRSAVIAAEVARIEAELATPTPAPGPERVAAAHAAARSVRGALAAMNDEGLRAVAVAFGAVFTVDLATGEVAVGYEEPYQTLFGRD